VWVGVVLLGVSGPGILDPGLWTGLLFLALLVHDDGTRVRRERFHSCPGGREAVMYAIEGGCHTWPGGRYLPPVFFGRTSRDLDVTDLMWRFFMQSGRSRPEPAER